jgi:hypothetical protein
MHEGTKVFKEEISGVHGSCHEQEIRETEAWRHTDRSGFSGSLFQEIFLDYHILGKSNFVSILYQVLL